MTKEPTPVSSASDSASIPLEEAIHNNSKDVLNAVVTDPSLTLDLALALLKRRDLPAQVVEQLGKNGTLMKSRKLKLAMVEHPRTPRHLSLPMVRHLLSGSPRMRRWPIDWKKSPWVKDFLWHIGRRRELPERFCSIPKRELSERRWKILV
ncbi:MAG: hypothetical protein AUI85_01825 [Acidobacteriales bacterium 13_1_40CM_3_55_5]|nr:MAG: hypothetical protein AUI85_01825 [Acidobacteriales bacterium 13_1_40CM_3_55_5]